ncbi:hypothetical protein L1987_23269 [Smallanthus sonchifolius]|uniref:Uncharacterized protein n=1 Tax=Smallanthus sonchifolius TaxID=185202 RepID=A0ACB9II25_9ASTR|nr:hypothetical protein L1987_23269 [Smallanthus sonchifolius]
MKLGVVPLEMYYRSTTEAIVDVPPKRDYENDLAYKLLVERPTDVQMLSKPMLVGVGMSHIWERLDRVPTLLLKSQGMRSTCPLSFNLHLLVYLLPLNSVVLIITPCEGFYDALFLETVVKELWFDCDATSVDILAQFEGNFLFPCLEKEYKSPAKEAATPSIFQAKSLSFVRIMQGIPMNFISDIDDDGLIDIPLTHVCHHSGEGGSHRAISSTLREC